MFRPLRDMGGKQRRIRSGRGGKWEEKSGRMGVGGGCEGDGKWEGGSGRRRAGGWEWGVSVRVMGSGG